MPSNVAYRFLEAAREMEKQKEKKGKASRTPVKTKNVLKKPAAANAGSKSSRVLKRPAAKFVGEETLKTPDRKTKPLSEPAGTPWEVSFPQ